MVVHLVFDFSYLYYKYFFKLKSGYLKTLTFPMEWNGSVIEKDVSLIYYTMAEIEGKRRELEELGHSVVSTVCFDMPSERKNIDGGENYKAGRVNHLQDEDFKNIQFIESLLSKAGHNTYRYEGYEADDLVTFLVNNYKDVFDYTIIYTPDKDLLINIDKNVAVKRYKSTSGYTVVNKENYTNYLSSEFGCTIPYNAILLYLTTVGDTSDKVKGINKFGKKAFDKLINTLNSKYNIEWDKCNDPEYFNKVLDMVKENLTSEQAEQMMSSYNLVKPMELDFIPPAPDKKTSYELRKEAYEPYKFVSLIK